MFLFPLKKNLLSTPIISITEALMASNSHFPKEKSGLHLGNIGQHNSFIKFLKQNKFVVSGTALGDYTNFLCAFFTSLLWYIDPHYNKIKSRSCSIFPEVTGKYLINFNKPNEHTHKAKTINS